VALNAPKPDEIPSGMRGNRDEAMTVRQHEPVWELNPRLGFDHRPIAYRQSSLGSLGAKALVVLLA